MSGRYDIKICDESCSHRNCYDEGRLCIPDTRLPRVIVVGGGFAGINLIKKLRNWQVQLVLIDKNNFHQFLPLLYQVAACGIEPDSIVFPYRKLFDNYRNVIFRMAEINRVDTDNNILYTSIGSLSYDYLVIATGVSPNFYGNTGFEKLGLALNSVTDALDIRSKILQNLEKASSTCIQEERESLCSIAIVGGGPAGVELSGAMAEFKKYILHKDYPELRNVEMKIFLLEGGPRIMPWLPEKVSEKAHQYLTDLKVAVILNRTVTAYNGKEVILDNGEKLNATVFIWTAGVKGSAIVGLPTETINEQKRILVDDNSRVHSLNHVFAIGNIAIMKTKEYPFGHPMVAQVAIQQGRTLALNLMRLIGKKPTIPFNYRDKGSMATIGKKKAVARIKSWYFSGHFAWFIWSIVHLMGIIGARNKILVAINWLWSYFTYDKGDRVIIRKYIQK